MHLPNGEGELDDVAPCANTACGQPAQAIVTSRPRNPKMRLWRIIYALLSILLSAIRLGISRFEKSGPLPITIASTDVGLRDDFRSCGTAFRSQGNVCIMYGGRITAKMNPYPPKRCSPLKLNERPIASQAKSWRSWLFPVLGGQVQFGQRGGPRARRTNVGEPSSLQLRRYQQKPARTAGRRSCRRSGLPPRDPCAMPAARGCRFGRSQSWSRRHGRGRTAGRPTRSAMTNDRSLELAWETLLVVFDQIR